MAGRGCVLDPPFASFHWKLCRSSVRFANNSVRRVWTRKRCFPRLCSIFTIFHLLFRFLFELVVLQSRCKIKTKILDAVVPSYIPKSCKSCSIALQICKIISGITKSIKFLNTDRNIHRHQLRFVTKDAWCIGKGLMNQTGFTVWLWNWYIYLHIDAYIYIQSVFVYVSLTSPGGSLANAFSLRWRAWRLAK